MNYLIQDLVLSLGKGQLYGNPANIHSDIIFKTIDDLAERRNDVAHGVDNIQLLNNSIIKDYNFFILSYSKSIYNILLNERNKYLFNETINQITPISVYNNNILCGSIENIDLSTSNFILVKKSKRKFPQYEKLKIKSIQLNNKNYEFLKITKKTDVGIEVDGKIKINYQFKVVSNNE